MSDSFTSDTYEALCRDAEGYLARGLAEQARELLLKATDLIGTRPRARSVLADACMSLGLWDEAREQLEALSTLEINNIYTHFRLGQVLEELGDLELALDNYKVVADINPEHHGARTAIARIDRKAPLDKPEEAVPVADGAQVFPDLPGSDDVFAGEAAGVDRLLEDMGMNGKPRDEGVSELLSNMGISAEDRKREEPKPAMDLDAIFGTSTSGVEEEGREGLSEVFRQAADLAQPLDEQDSPPIEVVFGSEERAPESEGTVDFAALFSSPEPAPVSEPPAVEEEPPLVELQAEEPPEKQEAADLSAVFAADGGEAGVAVEPPVMAEADLSAVFAAAGEKTGGAEEPPVMAEADLSAVFAKDGGEAGVAEEPPAMAEADLSAVFAADDEETGVAFDGEAPTEAGDDGEPSLRLREEADLTTVPDADAGPGPETPAKADAPSAAGYVVHQAENLGIPVMQLHSGSVRIGSGFLLAMDEGIDALADGDGVTRLTGTGTVLLGQGYGSPVVFPYTPEMTARYDMLAVRPDGIGHEPLGFAAVPSLAVLRGDAVGDLVFFCAGRTRTIRLHCGMKVRAGALVAADCDIRVKELPEEWLWVSGEGRVLLSS